MERASLFKRLPGHEKFYTPRSEYLLKLLQPELDDDLFLGKEYERVFDRFEVLLALACAVRYQQKDRNAWGPVGRFGWKLQRSVTGCNPLAEVIADAERLKTEWPPFKAGIFGPSFEEFTKAAKDYAARIGQLGWF